MAMEPQSPNRLKQDVMTAIMLKQAHRQIFPEHLPKHSLANFRHVLNFTKKFGREVNRQHKTGPYNLDKIVLKQLKGEQLRQRSRYDDTLHHIAHLQHTQDL